MTLLSRRPLSAPSPSLSLASGKEYRLRPLKRGDKEAAFRLLASDGWAVPASEQETVLSWVVQHPETESLVAHDAQIYSRLYGIITMSHRPQLRFGGRVASIDVFVIAPEQRHKGIGHDLLSQTLRRAEALGCKRVEMLLPAPRDERHGFFEHAGFVNTGNDLYIRQSPSLFGAAEKK